MTSINEMEIPERSEPPTDPQEIYREHIKIERRYLRIMHTSIGRLYRIPDCCIKQFVEEVCLGIMVAQYRQLKHQKLIPPQVGYVPCDECMAKL